MVERLEKTFREAITEELRNSIKDMNVRVEEHKNLWYSLHVSDEGCIEPLGNEPKRGYDAFQQDIVIYETRGEREVPRVVVETKSGGCSTHEAITYSTKARLLKQVYPYLRYILLLCDVDKITQKLIKHGEFFDGILVLDFAAQRKGKNFEDWNRFVNVIRNEVETSRKIAQARKGSLSVKAFLKPVTINESS